MKTKKDLKLRRRGASHGLTSEEKDARFVAIRDAVAKRVKGPAAVREHHPAVAGAFPHARVVGLRKRAARVDSRT